MMRFLDGEGDKAVDIHRMLKEQYRDTSVSLRRVYESYRKFKNGASNLVDTTRSGRPHTVNTPDTNT